MDGNTAASKDITKILANNRPKNIPLPLQLTESKFSYCKKSKHVLHIKDKNCP